MTDDIIIKNQIEKPPGIGLNPKMPSGFYKTLTVKPHAFRRVDTQW